MHKLATLAKLGNIGVLLFQGLLLNKFLSDLHGQSWWAWMAADAFNILVWLFILMYAHHQYKKYGIDKVDAREDPTMFPDEIKYVFVMWASYILLLIPRVIILFSKHAPQLKEQNVFGPNFLKVALSCTPLAFFFMICGFHNAQTGSKRKYYISMLISTVTLDLFDSIDLLEFLFEPAEVPQGYLSAMLFFACFNFMLPVMPLYEFHTNNFAGRVTGIPFKILYSCSVLFLVNAPNLVLRSVMWHKYNIDVSVLIMKNVICILINVNEIIEYLTEDRPAVCPHCKYHYRASHFSQHVQNCSANARRVQSSEDETDKIL